MARRHSIASADRVTLRWILFLTCAVALASLIAQGYLQNDKSVAPLEFIRH